MTGQTSRRFDSVFGRVRRDAGQRIDIPWFLRGGFPSTEGQILAANVDHAIVAVSPAVEVDLGRIERFLALAWESAT